MCDMIVRSILLFILLSGCSGEKPVQEAPTILPGAYQMEEYLHLLEGKNVGLTVNHSSLIEQTHLVDTLQSLSVNVAKVYTPEHGFKGIVTDGVEIEEEEIVADFELVSLYGKNKKPTSEQLEGIDVMIFDIQDVGTRFYTYISTMQYVMEASAENNIPVIILDRPNPNGSYVDGPVLDTAFRSFVGLNPIPIVHGMTVGELAQMINGEQWMKNGIACDLTVVKAKNWDHKMPYSLPVRPSPNLPNDLSIALYPSLCLFQGTVVSVGRGTNLPHQQIGHPNYPDTTHSFYPVSMEGAKYPPLENQTCYGISFEDESIEYAFTLSYLINMYESLQQEDFFNAYFKRLAGTDLLQKQIESGMSEEEIRETWKNDLVSFKEKRKTYLLYSE